MSHIGRWGFLCLPNKFLPYIWVGAISEHIEILKKSMSQAKERKPKRTLTPGTARELLQMKCENLSDIQVQSEYSEYLRGLPVNDDFKRYMTEADTNITNITNRRNWADSYEVWTSKYKGMPRRTKNRKVHVLYWYWR